MPQITVLSKSSNLGFHFQVNVQDGRGATTHRVTMDKDFLTRFGFEGDPEKLVKAAFQFLLKKEPKEAILPEFDITTIAKYYPDFYSNLGKQLEAGISDDY